MTKLTIKYISYCFYRIDKIILKTLVFLYISFDLSLIILANDMK